MALVQRYLPGMPVPTSPPTAPAAVRERTGWRRCSWCRKNRAQPGQEWCRGCLAVSPVWLGHE